MPRPRRSRSRSGRDPALTLPQLELMNLAWERGEISGEEARAALAKSRPVALTTVLTLLRRLEGRGLLAHRVDGRTFRYRAIRGKEASVAPLLRRLRDVLFSGSTEGLLSTLLNAGDVTDDEVRRLKARLARHEAGGGSR